MDSLIIEPTDDSPGISFDLKTNRFVIYGRSRPENTVKFYTPVVNWISNYEKTLSSSSDQKGDKSNRALIFKMEYFNSISAKYFLDLILIIKDFVTKGYAIKIEWHYAKQDDDMFDIGKEFSIMANLKFDFIEY